MFDQFKASEKFATPPKFEIAQIIIAQIITFLHFGYLNEMFNEALMSVTNYEPVLWAASGKL